VNWPPNGAAPGSPARFSLGRREAGSPIPSYLVLLQRFSEPVEITTRHTIAVQH